MINRVNLIQIERQDPGFVQGTPGFSNTYLRFYLSHGKKPRDIQLFYQVFFSPFNMFTVYYHYRTKKFCAILYFAVYRIDMTYWDSYAKNLYKDSSCSLNIVLLCILYIFYALCLLRRLKNVANRYHQSIYYKRFYILKKSFLFKTYFYMLRHCTSYELLLQFRDF